MIAQFFIKNHLLSGSPLSDSIFTPPHPNSPTLLKHLLFLFFVGCLCACQPENAPSPPIIPNNVLPAIAEGDSLCVSILEQVGSWKVVAILKKVGMFSCDISSDDTEAIFANGEVRFYVPYLSISFDGAQTIEKELYGPYPVEYSATNILIIDDVSFRVTAASNDIYTLTSQNLEIQLQEQ